MYEGMRVCMCAVGNNKIFWNFISVVFFPSSLSRAFISKDFDRHGDLHLGNGNLVLLHKTPLISAPNSL